MLEGSSSNEALAAAMKIGSYIYLVLMPFGIVLLEVWNIACRMLGKKAYPLWSLGLSTGLTAGYIFIGNCLMLWRCYAIWNQRKWAALIPAALLLTSISRLYSQTYRAALGIVTAVGSASHWHDIPPLLAILWVAFSVATNLSATSLIIYKLLVTPPCLHSDGVGDTPGQWLASQIDGKTLFICYRFSFAVSAIRCAFTSNDLISHFGLCAERVGRPGE
ncbi:hypothetical protein BKA70DRAFT_1225429 [Coprinopsis sp. MPI-PUGE-AT-0042]|nr:hypothetical protein BKA70DRAFT_1225429 [Coprinopsis sp. MPI-PUGE-AT-0042]